MHYEIVSDSFFREWRRRLVTRDICTQTLIHSNTTDWDEHDQHTRTWFACLILHLNVNIKPIYNTVYLYSWCEWLARGMKSMMFSRHFALNFIVPFFCMVSLNVHPLTITRFRFCFVYFGFIDVACDHLLVSRRTMSIYLKTWSTHPPGSWSTPKQLRFQRCRCHRCFHSDNCNWLHKQIP